MLPQNNFPYSTPQNQLRRSSQRKGRLQLVGGESFVSVSTKSYGFSALVLPPAGDIPRESVSVAFLPIDLLLDDLDDHVFHQIEQLRQEQTVINALNQFARNGSAFM